MAVGYILTFIHRKWQEQNSDPYLLGIETRISGKEKRHKDSEEMKIIHISRSSGTRGFSVLQKIEFLYNNVILHTVHIMLNLKISHKKHISNDTIFGTRV